MYMYMYIYIGTDVKACCQLAVMTTKTSRAGPRTKRSNLMRTKEKVETRVKGDLEALLAIGTMTRKLGVHMFILYVHTYMIQYSMNMSPPPPVTTTRTTCTKKNPQKNPPKNRSASHSIHPSTNPSNPRPPFQHHPPPPARFLRSRLLNNLPTSTADIVVSPPPSYANEPSVSRNPRQFKLDEATKSNC